MARIAYPSPDTLPQRLQQELAARVKPDRGNVWRMLMITPDTAGAFIDYSEMVRHHSLIPPKLREVIILRVGHLCEAVYEVHQHVRIAREVGLSEAQIEATAIGADAPGLSDDERFAMTMTEELVRDKGLGQATFDKAVARHGERMVADIVLLVGFYTMACMFLKSFGIDIEQSQGNA
jgi:4-carboxymuconolactone decarboxylase